MTPPSERVVLPDHRLGRLAKREDARNLRLASYLTLGPRPPQQLDLTAGIKRFPLYRNDRLNDCTCAAAGHMVEVWTQRAEGRVRLFTTREIVSLYDLVNNGQDKGAAMLDVLKAWRRPGLGGLRLYAFAEIDIHHEAQARAGCWLFSGLYVGLDMPLAAQGVDTWDVAKGPNGRRGSWGKHTVNIVGYDPQGLTAVSWGKFKRLTWPFYRRYVEEAYVCVPEMAQAELAEPGARVFDREKFEADLRHVTAPPPRTQVLPGPGR